MYPVFGASLLSAAASLPLHLMPFLVVTLSSGARLSPEQAGWIFSAYMAGQLVASIALPLLGVARLGLPAAAAAALVVAGGPWLSCQGTAPDLLATWFVIGTACGALQFLGATTAAAAPRKPAAFAMRLCAILVASAVAIVVLERGAGFEAYAGLVGQMGLLIAALAVFGLSFYRPPPVEPAAVTAGPGGAARQWQALAAIFLLFAGQPGFWAYAVQTAQQRGLEVGDAALAVAAAKALSALVLAVAVRRPAPIHAGLLAPGLAVGLGILLMAGARTLVPFVAGVLLWELAVNLLSVRFQAAVVQRTGAACGAWLAASIFLGAAAGPLVHGLAIAAQAQALFIAFACLSSLVPFAWSLLRGTGPAGRWA